MEQEKNGLVPSTAIWEIAIKIKNHKLDLGVSIDDYIATLKKSNVIRIVPIDEDIWLESVKLYHFSKIVQHSSTPPSPPRCIAGGTRILLHSF